MTPRFYRLLPFKDWVSVTKWPDGGQLSWLLLLIGSCVKRTRQSNCTLELKLNVVNSLFRAMLRQCNSGCQPLFFNSNFGSLISFVGVGHVVNRLIYLIWCNDIKALSLLLGCPIARQRLALGNSHSFVGK
jgi:hypothetical protein